MEHTDRPDQLDQLDPLDPPNHLDLLAPPNHLDPLDPPAPLDPLASFAPLTPDPTNTIAPPIEFADPFDSASFDLASIEELYPIDPGYEFVYCLMCIAWKQNYVSVEAPKFFPCKAVNPILVKRLWKGKEYKNVSYSLMPGYIFLFSTEPMDSGRFRDLDGALKVLQYAGGGYALTAEDEQLARWLLKYDGTIGISKAINVGDRIKVIQGPLKDYCGTIEAVNRHRQRAKVILNFSGNTWPVWVDLDFIEA